MPFVNTSSAGADAAAIAELCRRLLGRPVLRLERIAGGRNSQVFRLDCDDRGGPGNYVAKQYYSTPDDPRDRLQTEYRALGFLRKNGVVNVPAPIAADAPSRCAIYEFASGDLASTQPIGAGEIRQAVAFLVTLKTLARRGGADGVTAASEACFSIDAILESVRARLERLRARPDGSPGKPTLTRFLSERFEPFLATVDRWTDDEARAAGLSRSAEIPPADRTLSPSDFGFHNALRDEAGRLVFVDFEYFGWDDPAKMLVDFLHHPGMSMSAERRREFATGLLAAFRDVPSLAARSRIVYPWFGLKWCLILLNEFVPAQLRRRSFAGAVVAVPAELLDRQLAKADRLLVQLTAEYRNNIYVD